MVFNPHEYQQRAIDKVMSTPGCGLFLEMGLGKSVITLTAVKKLMYEEFCISRVLVIAPLKVAESTWSRECEKWDHLRDLSIVRILGGAKKRTEAAALDADVFIVNREQVAWLVRQYPGEKWRWDMVVIDELSSFKNSASQRFRALRRVRPYIRRIVGLTGTPSPNSYMDLWAQIYLLDRGERLGATIGSYRQRFFKPGKRKGYVVYEWQLVRGADKAIREKLSDIVVSMSASDYLKLPERIENEVRVHLPDKVLLDYARLEREQLLMIDDDTSISAASAAAVMTKLLQLAGGAVYDDDGGYQTFHDEKIKALMEIIDTAQSPVLVFYGFRHERERLLNALSKLSPRELKTDRDIDDWNRGGIQILMAHPASVGYGLNLQAGGHVIVWYSLPWSLELYQQANARLHRQGQTEAVVINQLVATGTVDEQVLMALRKKDTGQKALMGALKERLKI